MNTAYQRERRQRLSTEGQRVFFSAELHPKTREALHRVAQRSGQWVMLDRKSGKRWTGWTEYRVQT